MTPRRMPVFSRVFALEVDGKPTLAFEARNVTQAQELCKESWLRDDLTSLKSGGVSLGNADAKLLVRPATAEETAVFREAADVVRPSGDMVLAYLVKLDG